MMFSLISCYVLFQVSVTALLFFSPNGESMYDHPPPPRVDGWGTDLQRECLEDGMFFNQYRCICYF